MGHEQKSAKTFDSYLSVTVGSANNTNPSSAFYDFIRLEDFMDSYIL